MTEISIDMMEIQFSSFPTLFIRFDFDKPPKVSSPPSPIHPTAPFSLDMSALIPQLTT